MKKNANEKIMMLQYRIKRYQAMGNGAMCQTLNGKLQKLLTKQPAMLLNTLIYIMKRAEQPHWFSALSFYFFFKVTSLISTTPPLFCPRIAT